MCVFLCVICRPSRRWPINISIQLFYWRPVLPSSSLPSYLSLIRTHMHTCTRTHRKPPVSVKQASGPAEGAHYRSTEPPNTKAWAALAMGWSALHWLERVHRRTKGREGREGKGRERRRWKRAEERRREPRALRMSGDPERESLAGAQRGTEGRRRRRKLKLHGYIRTLTFTQPSNICCFLLALHPYLPLPTDNTGTKTESEQRERSK